jgi:hypothetical protein
MSYAWDEDSKGVDFQENCLPSVSTLAQNSIGEELTVKLSHVEFTIRPISGLSAGALLTDGHALPQYKGFWLPIEFKIPVFKFYD